jgi:hypothetical protein
MKRATGIIFRGSHFFVLQAGRGVGGSVQESGAEEIHVEESAGTVPSLFEEEGRHGRGRSVMTR